jgi:hypothetical protein
VLLCGAQQDINIQLDNTKSIIIIQHCLQCCRTPDGWNNGLRKSCCLFFIAL